MSETTLEKIISFAKRRGFVFQSSEIYGGFGAAYDFGPLGVLLKNNIKKVWFDWMLKKHDNMVGLDSAILMSPLVWQSSGHLSAGFADELVECKDCHKRFRLDEMIDSSNCPECKGKFIEPRKFNLMMKTYVGPIEDEAARTYLRAETCQGIYVNFEHIMNSMRLKLPFGAAQIGKAFRNEITPKDFLYRTREFEQMEMEWFCSPKDAAHFFDYWLKGRLQWHRDLGIKEENIRVYEVPQEKLPHYAKRAVDIEYKFPFGWREIEGIHNRGDWDLSNHSKHCKKELTYTDDEGNTFYPHIVETSVGVDRLFLALLCNAYEEVRGGRTTTTEAVKEEEVLLRISKNLAPIQIAVFPLLRSNKNLVQKAQELFGILKQTSYVQYDETGSIGRRYRRQDEIGTPFCVTVDHQTLKDGTVTVRDRDSMKQERIASNLLSLFFREHFPCSF